MTTAYSGPASYGERGSTGVGLSGPLSVRHSTSPGSRDYSGPLRIPRLMAELSETDFEGRVKVCNDLIQIDSEIMWKNFSGSRRVFANTLYLDYANTANLLGLSSQIVNYRFGSRQDLKNTPDNLKDGILQEEGDASLEFHADGIKASRPSGSLDNTNAAGVYLGGSVAEYGILHTQPTPDPPGPVSATVLSFWAKWGPLSGTVVGWNHEYAYDTFNSWYTRFYIESTWSDLRVVALSTDEFFEYGDFSHTYALPAWAKDESLRHFLVQIIGHYDIDTQIYEVRTRLFVDGKFIGGTTTKPWLNPPEPIHVVDITPRGSLTPALLGVSKTSHADRSQTLGTFGQRTLDSPWHYTVDELSISNDYAVRDSGGTAILDANWNSEEQVFSVSRHPNIEISGPRSSDFISESQVFETCLPPTGGVTGAEATITNLPNPLPYPYGPHQRVDLSFRASDSAFSQNDTFVEWSEWLPMGDGSLASFGTKSLGKFVQARLRIFPSGDDTKMVSPGLSVLKIHLGDNGKQTVSQNFDGRLSIGMFQDFEARILVREQISENFDSKIFVQYPVPILDAQARIFVSARADFEGRIRLPKSYDFDARININERNLSRDFEARVNIASTMIDMYDDFDARVHVQQGVSKNFDARINFPSATGLFEGRVLLQEDVFRNFNSRVFVVPERPNPVQNLESTTPEAIFVTNPVVQTEWDAPVPKISPVVGYRYKLTQNEFEVPDNTWDSTNDLHQNFNMANAQIGSGKWWFHVASENDIGYFSDLRSYQIWYNNTPSIPGVDYMRIDDLDTKAQSPLRPSKVDHLTLSWAASTDPDPTPHLVYEIHIATQDDFGPILGTNDTSIVQIHQNIGQTYLNWSNLPDPGVYFWRIRCSDTLQPSEWSDVGSFRLNAPPGRPIGLLVTP